MNRETLAPGLVLSEYRVSAVRPIEDAENQIHDDRVAREFGFKSGLVPGFIVYGWMTHPVVDVLGLEWLSQGFFSVRFIRPIYYEEPVTVKARVMARNDDTVTIETQAHNAAGESCAIGTMGIAVDSPPSPPDLVRYAAAPLPTERPVVSREHLARLAVLGTPKLLLDEAVTSAFLRLVNETLPLYFEADAPAHPAFYLDQANRALDQNVRVSPWLHVESQGQHLDVARVGRWLSTLGRVKSLFERKRHAFVELDLLLVADNSRPVASIRHVAIYKIAQPV